MRREANGEYRDVFLMSKGHGCMIQYVILEEQGVLSRQDLDAYCKPNGRLGAHPDYETPGIAASTGSLGHGLGMATGQAYAEKLKNTDVLIYCVLSDGEFQEGSTWEAMMMAANLKLDNLIAFMDFNDFGGLERMSDGHPAFYPLVPKAESFGWEAVEVDGHDEEAMHEAVMSRRGGRPMLRGLPHRQGQGHLLHGERRRSGIIARPTRKNISRASRNSRKRRYEKSICRHVLRTGQSRSAALRRRRRYFAGRLDRKIPQGISAPLRQYRRFRADHDRHDRRHGAARAASRSPTRSRPSRSIVRSRWCATIFVIRTLPVTIVGIGGGVTYSTLGATHHAQEDVAIASAIPNLSVIAPCDPGETEAATRWCAAQEHGPVYLRLGKAGEPDLSKAALDPWVFGKLRQLRAGRDVCILSYGPIMKRAFALAERFEAAGKSAAVCFGPYAQAARPRGADRNSARLTPTSSSSRNARRTAVSPCA